MSDEKVLIRVAELAKLLSVSPVTIQRWRASGSIPRGSKVGGARLWLRAEIIAWAEAGSPPLARWEAIVAASKRGAK